jgi:hypothetical protein
MSDRMDNAVAFGNRMREQKCTTVGHEDRKGKWLVPKRAAEPEGAQRWVCDECKRGA